MNIILTESQLKLIVNESQEERMITKAKTIYKAFKWGRSMVKPISIYPALDVSYTLPDIDSCTFRVRPSYNDATDLMVFITMYKPVDFVIHNTESIPGESYENLQKHWGSELGYVYRKKFDQFNIAIGEDD
jgi:hypothetical protein